MSNTTNNVPIADPVVVPTADPEPMKPDEEIGADAAARAVAPAERRRPDYVFMTIILFVLGAVGGISGVSIKSKKGGKPSNGKPNKPQQQKPDYDIDLDYNAGGGGAGGGAGGSGYNYNYPSTPQQQPQPQPQNTPQVPAPAPAPVAAADPLRVVVFGKWYDFTNYAAQHPGGSDVMWQYNAWDMSGIWPRTPPGLMNAGCLDSNKYLDLLMSQMTPVCENQELPCHNQMYGTYLVQLTLSPYYLADYVVTQADLDASGRTYVIISGYIYDVTAYVNAISSDYNNDPNAYLEYSLHNLIMSNLNSDATDAYYQTYGTSANSCLDEFYYAQLSAS